MGLNSFWQEASGFAIGEWEHSAMAVYEAGDAGRALPERWAYTNKPAFWG